MSKPTLEERLRALLNVKAPDPNYRRYEWDEVLAAAAIGDAIGYARGRAEVQAEINELIDLAQTVDENWTDADGHALDAIVARHNAIRAAAKRTDDGGG